MKNIYIIGAGGHAKVVADIILKRKNDLNDEIFLKGFLDDNFDENKNIEIFKVKLIGKIEKVEKLKQDKSNYFIIAIGDNKIREKISIRYNELNYYTAIHPNTVIGNEVSIEKGTVVMAGVVINPYTTIGKHSIINTSSVIEHDNEIGDYVHICPKSTTAGNVKIEKGVWLGIGSTVIQGKIIGENTIIGAGSIVVKDINENVKAYGSPCREIDKI